MQNKVIYIMGVSGSGKSTIGTQLSKEQGIPFFDGDDFHPKANIDKMKSGQALNDSDRWPWLEAIHTFVGQQLGTESVIIACSALKESYREVLKKGIDGQVIWVYLNGDFDLISKRMSNRDGHFMPNELLASQFETLEIPSYGIHQSIEGTTAEIVNQLISKIEMKKSEFGLVGLGVMGKSLSRNLADKGVVLSLYNRYLKDVEENVASDFIAQHSALATAQGFQDLSDFVQSLSLPRKIFLMIPAGKAIDEMIDTLIPQLTPGDVIIDGGNAHYKETERRLQKLKSAKLHYIGTGVSGGEEGALKGPSIMPGGSPEAYDLIKSYLERIAAKDVLGSNCCAFIGKGGAGHFVKMVHNGIEYAEMQLIAETYSLLRWGNGLEPNEIANIFESWNEGELQSYLLEITVQILRKKEKDNWMIDLILDKAGNKGTGSWTTIAACELGVPVPTISAALFARYISAFKDERSKSEQLYQTPYQSISIDAEKLRGAYRLARIVNHHQGIHLIDAASQQYDWQVDLSELARIWTNGCIIRSKLMQKLVVVLKNQTRILQDEDLLTVVKNNETALAEIVALAAAARISIPCHSASLNYLQSYVHQQSSANMIQAQRDFFGAHTYERVDDPSGKKYHTNWT